MSTQGLPNNVVVAKWQTQQVENLKAGSSSLPGDTSSNKPLGDGGHPTTITSPKQNHSVFHAPIAQWQSTRLSAGGPGIVTP